MNPFKQITSTVSTLSKPTETEAKGKISEGTNSGIEASAKVIGIGVCNNVKLRMHQCLLKNWLN